MLFSPASIWEVAIKAALGRPDFTVDADTLARAAIVSGFSELPIISAAKARAQRLPPIHNDPFDRILVAQAIEASVILLTADHLLPPYSPLIRRVPEANYRPMRASPRPCLLQSGTASLTDTGQWSDSRSFQPSPLSR